MDRWVAALALALVVTPAAEATAEWEVREEERSAIIMQLQATTSRECDSIRRLLYRETDTDQRSLLIRAGAVCEKALARLREWERGNVGTAIREAAAAMAEALRLVGAYEGEEEVPDDTTPEWYKATETTEQ